MLLSNLRVASAILLCATAFGASAVPAKPGIITVSQADGSEINVRLIGDERSHYTLSEDGYLLESVNGTYYYATISDDGRVNPSTLRATNVADRGVAERNYLSGINLTAQTAGMQARDAIIAKTGRMANAGLRAGMARIPGVPSEGYPMGPGLFTDTPYPTQGKQKGLVILVEYADEFFRLTDPRDYFSRLLNEPDFSDYGATGSATDFFVETSNGFFQPEFDVYGPVRLSKNMSYYGGNGPFGGDLYAERMVIEACQALDPEVDFSQYDRDGDGVIDNVFVFYAGLGEATGGGANTVWPHSWNITQATDERFYLDGVLLDRYACSNEWTDGRPDGIGTFVHEFSHVLGLPDLYATAYNGSFTPGAWSTMDVGPYNNSGMTPPLFSAFERYALGWIEPTELKAGMNVTLPAIGENTCAIVKTDKENEYFLFENRQQTSWDTFLPGHGMLVWHIDYDAAIWKGNVVNNTPSHQYVDLIEADGIRSDASRNADCFPGKANVTSFTADGTPKFATWDDTAIELPITDIVENNGVITFKVSGGNSNTISATEALPATDVTATSFCANWNKVDGAEGYVMTLRTVGSETETVFTDINVGDAGSFIIKDLEPSTQYEYTIAVGTPIEHSAASAPMAVTTADLSLDAACPKLEEASGINDTSFTANWKALPGATGYTLSISEKIWGEATTDMCDFTGGLSAMPYGWLTNCKDTYENSAYSGAAVPALKMSLNGDVFISPVFARPMSSVSFWHRGSTSSGSNDAINVYAKSGLKWTLVAKVPVVTTSGGETNKITDLPEGTVQVRLEYERKSMKGALALDDVAIEWGRDFETKPVAGYELAVNAGNETSYQFTGLTAGTTYTYNLVATDGTLTSQASAFADVTTSGGSGIHETVEASADFLLTGRTISALAPVEIFDLYGRRIGSVAAGKSVTVMPGLYVIRSSSAACKTIIR